MATVKTILTELKSLGKEQNRKIFARHGAPDDLFGVSVADLKVIAKRLRGEHELALELYDSTNADAMYLAGMIADGSQMTQKQLNDWCKQSNWQMISEYTVPGVACENENVRKLALKWIKSKKEKIASSGWCSYSGMLATQDDDQLDEEEIAGLLETIEGTIHDAENRVRYTMNGFVISAGSYYKPLLKLSKSVAKKIGKVNCDVGETACKVPVASDMIKKIETMKRVGKKRKTVKC